MHRFIDAGLIRRVAALNRDCHSRWFDHRVTGREHQHRHDAAGDDDEYNGHNHGSGLLHRSNPRRAAARAETLSTGELLAAEAIAACVHVSHICETSYHTQSL